MFLCSFVVARVLGVVAVLTILNKYKLGLVMLAVVIMCVY